VLLKYTLKLRVIVNFDPAKAAQETNIKLVHLYHNYSAENKTRVHR